MSLQLKLVLLVLGLTVLLLCGLGLVVGAALPGWTQEVVDAELSRRAAALTHEVQFEDGALELDDDDDGLALRGLPFRIETEGGALLLGSDAWPAATLSGLGFTTAQTRGGEQVRVLSVAFRPEHGGDDRLVLRVAAPLTAVSGVAQRFRDGLLVALLLAAVLSTLGAAILAQWFLAPLRKLSGAVDALEASSLVGRLPTQGMDPALRRLADAFNGLLDRVASVVAGQREFVSRASHALRTPLASTLTQAEVALMRERTPESYRATLEAIAATTRGAAQLTDGLLALTRADAAATPIALQQVDLTHLAVELRQLFGPRADALGLGLEFVVPDGLTVRSTRARLREMLDALLDNAVRYTPRDGKVRFEARTEGKTVTLEIRDTGPGLSPDDRVHAFDRFFRGTAAAASGQPGSGLGLAVVKALADSEGAEVTFGDAPGGGARVLLRFAGPQGL